eukprot:8572156-Pyramimonas_sp.AAC.1
MAPVGLPAILLPIGALLDIAEAMHRRLDHCGGVPQLVAEGPQLGARHAPQLRKIGQRGCGILQVPSQVQSAIGRDV